MRSDAQLADAAIAGDTQAFAELVARHERGVHATAFSILRNHHDAEDAVQEAFVAAYRALPTLHNRSSFGPWVITITLRLARDIAQRRRQLVSLPESASLPEERSESDVDGEKLFAAILRLSEAERDCVLLRHFDGHDMQTIANITGEGIGTITKRLSRAHARLKEILAG